MPEAALVGGSAGTEWLPAPKVWAVLRLQAVASKLVESRDLASHLAADRPSRQAEEVLSLGLPVGLTAGR